MPQKRYLPELGLWANDVIAAVNSDGSPLGAFGSGAPVEHNGGSVYLSALEMWAGGTIVVVNPDGTPINTNLVSDLATKVAKAGDTMTGNLTVDKAAPELSLNKVNGNNANLSFKTAGSYRWAMASQSGAESGSNVGSDLWISRFDDAGGYVDSPLTISRADGAMNARALNVHQGGADGRALLLSGETKGLRFVAAPGHFIIEGVDHTGVASYQPLALSGSKVDAIAPFNTFAATTVVAGTAPAAGGAAGAGIMMSSTANLGVFFGSGAPTLSAAKGSLYLRTDGTTTNDRMYVNTNGSTTWTAVITVA